jgi:glyoxylase-like metal-dependent hydrolase (beta-lactamase superfamily II)/ferredoxin
MARHDLRHPDGVEGDWFIDTHCIGCGASTSIAPRLIELSSDGRRFVFRRQPRDGEEVLLAQMAAEVCPTRSIGTGSGLRWEPHHPVDLGDRVWRCGSNSPDSAGGNSYLVQRDAGNLLVDGPRFVGRLVRALEALGGVRHVLLTHADDVGEAERYAEAFGADVLIHEADRRAAPFATRIVSGSAPAEVAPGVQVIPTPGHTAGHVMFLVDDRVLLSGDSLVWDPHSEDLWAEETVCWHSWPQQLASLERLAAFSFSRVVPGHGALSPTLATDEMRARLVGLVARLRD